MQTCLHQSPRRFAQPGFPELFFGDDKMLTTVGTALSLVSVADHVEADRRAFLLPLRRWGGWLSGRSFGRRHLPSRCGQGAVMDSRSHHGRAYDRQFGAPSLLESLRQQHGDHRPAHRSTLRCRLPAGDRRTYSYWRNLHRGWNVDGLPPTTPGRWRGGLRLQPLLGHQSPIERRQHRVGFASVGSRQRPLAGNLHEPGLYRR